ARFTATIAFAIAAFSLALFTVPALAAPETPQVRQGHGAAAAAYSWDTGYRGLVSAFEYGLTDRLAVRGVWDEGRYDTWPDQSHQWSVSAKYGLSPNLALEAFAERGWDEVSSGNLYGFGLFTGQQFGPLYASLRAQAIAYPFWGSYRWADELTAAGTYQLTRNLNLLGSVKATLDFGTSWSGSYGVEYQATPQLAFQVNRFTGSDATQVGAELRF
ncbi:MAG: hypothetical protein ACM3RP_13330, partial [Chitinophagales bacterium]